MSANDARFSDAVTALLVSPELATHVHDFVNGLEKDYASAQRLPIRMEPAVWVFHFETSYGRRVLLLIRDFVRAVNERRILAAALSLRAVMELAGALVHFERKIRPLVTNEISKEDGLKIHEQLDQAVSGSRFDWGRFLSPNANDRDALLAAFAATRRDAEEPPAELVQLNVSTFIGTLEKAVAERTPEAAGSIRLARAYLSDLCHPAAGGDIVHVRSAHPDGSMQYGLEPSQFAFVQFLNLIALPTLLLVGTEWIDHTNRLRQFSWALREGRIVIAR